MICMMTAGRGGECGKLDSIHSLREEVVPAHWYVGNEGPTPALF